MKRTIFLYKLLLALSKNNPNKDDSESNVKYEISIKKIYENYDIFAELLDQYGLEEYKFKNKQEFIFELLDVFADFEMGIYVDMSDNDKDSKQKFIKYIYESLFGNIDNAINNGNYKLVFYENNYLEETIFNLPLKDISDKLINELAMIFSLGLENNKKKQLLK